MKKIIFSVFAIFALASTVQAEKTTVVTTYSVPGRATGVTVNHSTGAVSTNCDPCETCVCQSGTITVTTESGMIVNTHMTIDVTAENGTRYQISGNLVDKSAGVLPNGGVQYNYRFSNMRCN
jgi:hypothetical protein